jgi:hypothetical protein
MHHSILPHLTTATGQGRRSNPLLSRRRISAVPQQADYGGATGSHTESSLKLKKPKIPA